LVLRRRLLLHRGLPKHPPGPGPGGERAARWPRSSGFAAPSLPRGRRAQAGRLGGLGGRVGGGPVGGGTGRVAFTSAPGRGVRGGAPGADGSRRQGPTRRRRRPSVLGARPAPGLELPGPLPVPARNPSGNRSGRGPFFELRGTGGAVLFEGLARAGAVSGAPRELAGPLGHARARGRHAGRQGRHLPLQRRAAAKVHGDAAPLGGGGARGRLHLPGPQVREVGLRPGGGLCEAPRQGHQPRPKPGPGAGAGRRGGRRGSFGGRLGSARRWGLWPLRGACFATSAA